MKLSLERLLEFGERLASECKDALGSLLPFSTEEREFLDRLLDEGEIEPELITDDGDLQAKIRNHPWLKWKALNVKEYRNIQ